MQTEILSSFYLDRARTPAQDIRYQFQQLTDVIVRALSPGINDPFTAINGIDELASSAVLLSRHATVSEQRQDQSGHVRLIIPCIRIGEILKETVGHITVYGSRDPFVMRALQRVLDNVSTNLSDPGEIAVVQELQREMEFRSHRQA